MNRTHALALLGLAVFLAALPAAAGELRKKDKKEKPLVTRLTVNLPAGRFAALRWDPAREGFVAEYLPPPPPELPARAEEVLAKVPAWLREPLRLQLRRLPLVPVRVEDGQTIFLAGLLSEETSNQVKKLPILGDIPLLGILFQHRRETVIRSNLIIEITPKIILDPADLSFDTDLKSIDKKADTMMQKNLGVEKKEKKKQ